MKTKRPHSIRHSLMGLTILTGFLLSAALSLLCVVFLWQTALVNRLHSTQFNLQLLSGDTMARVQELQNLLEWPEKNPNVEHYLTNLKSYETVLLTTYTLMDNQLRSCTCKNDVVRYLLTDGKYRTLEVLRNQAESRLVSSVNLEELDGLADRTELWWDYIGTDPLTVGPLQVIPLGHAIRSSRDGSVIGYVYLSVSTDFLTEAAANYGTEEGSRLLWRLGDTYWEIADGALTPLPEGSIQVVADLNRYTNTENCEISRVRLDGQQYYYVSVEMEGAGMCLVEMLPRLAMSVPGSSILLAVCLCFVIMALFALVEQHFLNCIITDPVNRLQKQIGRLSGGELVPDPSLEWDNEFGEIGRGINQMATSISSLMEKQLEDEKQKQNLEYQMLQGQINPHFIFNTLYSIKWMATFQNAPSIVEMTTALARLLKSVSKGNKKLVPLYSELALLNDYVIIQNYRYGGNISVDIRTIEDESLCQRCMIPRFTLQPLVENAIFHGIEPNGGSGTVFLDILRDPQTQDVLIRIRDNGVGIPPEKLAHLLDPPAETAPTRAVGLWNVSRRLQYHFGLNYHLQLESEPGNGTVVTIRLPAPEEDAL